MDGDDDDVVQCEGSDGEAWENAAEPPELDPPAEEPGYGYGV